MTGVQTCALPIYPSLQGLSLRGRSLDPGKHLDKRGSRHLRFLPEPGIVSDWWDKMLVDEPSQVRKRRSGRIIYTIWAIWKERNRRVFTGQRTTHREVALLAFENIKQRDMAFVGALPSVGIG